jgi:beta-glucosidase
MSELPGDFLWGAASPRLAVGQPAWREDVELVAGLGLRAFRVPLAWPELQPDGRGPLERAPVDFYQRLVDALLERGVHPLAALHRGDLPGRLERAGGWQNRDAVGRFADFAQLLFRALGDRIARWVTHVDPWRIGFPPPTAGGIANGRLPGEPGRGPEPAPGLPGGSALRAGLPALHHLLLAHGQAVLAGRAELRTGSIGIALELAPVHPYGDDEQHLPAARLGDALVNRWLLEPVLRGSYPAEALEAVVSARGPLSFAREGDGAAVAQPVDFLSVIYRGRRFAEAAPREDLGVRLSPGPSAERLTLDGRDIHPRGLRDLLVRLTAELDAPPILVEAGAALAEPAAVDGRVRDTDRIVYLRDHLEALGQALAAGARVDGFLVSPLFDMPGEPGGGLVAIEPATGARRRKDSAGYLERVVREGLARAEPG